MVRTRFHDLNVRKIDVNPIGIVKTTVTKDKIKKRTHISKIHLNKELTVALEGISDFSHLLLIFWMHEIPTEKRNILKVHPRGRRDMPLLGVFSTRTPYRPNPLGLSIVELLKVEANIITVKGLDAFDGTPILDIKPLDYWDTAKQIKVPRWWAKLERERKKKKQ